MRKLIKVAVLALTVFAVLAFWQKDKILAAVRPAPVLLPIFRQPTVYDLQAALESSGINVSEPPIVSSGTIQASISGVLVIFSDSKDFATQVRSLQLVLPRLKMETKQVREIDLRFSKVVLRY